MNGADNAEIPDQFSVAQPPATDVCGWRLQLDGRDRIREDLISLGSRETSPAVAFGWGWALQKRTRLHETFSRPHFELEH